MLASGNSNKTICVNNLFKTIRGEVPFVRTKGIDGKLIDKPITQQYEVRKDVDQQIKIFEPRVRSYNLNMEPDEPIMGYLGFTIDVD